MDGEAIKKAFRIKIYYIINIISISIAIVLVKTEWILRRDRTILLLEIIITGLTIT